MIDVSMGDRSILGAHKAKGAPALALVAACVIATVPFYIWPLGYQFQVLPWAVLSTDLFLVQPLSVLTSVWIHLDIEHLAYNAGLIALFGWRLERVHGVRGTIALFLLVCLPAQLSFFWGASSVEFIAGASGGALGLIGAFLERRFFAADLLGRIERHPVVAILIGLWVVALLAGDTTEIRRVHGTGFVAGALVSSALARPGLERSVLRAGAAVTVLHIVATMACGVRVAAGYPSDPTAARWLLKLGTDDARVTNNLAWYWFKHPGAKPEIVAEAQSQLEGFLDSGLPAWGKDTLAAMKHGSGDLKGALELQRDAVREEARHPLLHALGQYEYEAWRSRHPQGLSASASWETVRDGRGLRLVRRDERRERLPERALLLTGDDVVGYLETRQVEGETSPDEEPPMIDEAIEPDFPLPSQLTLLPLPGPGLALGSESNATVWWLSIESGLSH